MELRKSNDGEALLLAARAQARLDGHPGVVAVHQARLTSGGALDLTVGEFFTADGVSLAGEGLKPDVRVPLPPRAKRDLQLNEACGVSFQW